MRVKVPTRFLQREIGLGDLVKAGTSAVGIAPCSSCQERAERLNRLVSLGPHTPSQGSEIPASEKPKPGDIAETPVTHSTAGSTDPAESQSACCIYAVTVISKPTLKWPWWFGWLGWLFSWFTPPPAPVTAIRVTGVSPTTILDASGDIWNQSGSLPTSVTWTPENGGPIPTGDPADSWIIDNDFMLSLGPVNGTPKHVTIDFINAAGNVVDSFDVTVPCQKQHDVNVETDWEGFTHTVKGGATRFAYLEADDCDPFDAEKTDTLATITFAAHCVGNEYVVDLNAAWTGTGTADTYEWSGDVPSMDVPAGQPYSPTLAPGIYTVNVNALDTSSSPADILGSGTTSIDLTSPNPDFSSSQSPCSKVVTFDASGTSASADNPVEHWHWTCTSASVTFSGTPPTGGTDSPTVSADFATAGVGAYQVTLEVTDHYGCTWSTTKTINVVDCQASMETPSYSWCVAKINPEIKSDVVVAFKSTSIGCPPFTWDWDFGDGSPHSTDENPTHTYVQAKSGDQHQVTLTVKDSSGCTSHSTVTLTIEQRVGPAFTYKACPDGKVILETNDPGPSWTLTPSPTHVAPWPYSSSIPALEGKRLIVSYDNDGVYSATLKSTNQNGNHCDARHEFTVHHDCCAKNAHTSAISSAFSAQIGNTTATLRIKARLRQLQEPFVHRVVARTILQRLNSHGHWRRYRSPHVEIDADFTGTVWRSESAVFNWGNGAYYRGCNCWTSEPTNGSKVLTNVRKVKAVDGIGARFRSKVNSITSQHRVSVNGGPSQVMATLKLGQQTDCDSFQTKFHWWLDWF